MIHECSMVLGRSPRAVFPQLVLWPEASWWPDGVRLRYERDGVGPSGRGARYRVRGRGVAAGGRIEVIDVEEGHSVTFLHGDGAVEGVTHLIAEPVREGCRVAVVEVWTVRGAWGRLRWRLGGAESHRRDLQAVLDSLRRYLE
ncbi:MAG: SRPBCC family protein [Planctomycetes bacterium]|nr:SRPBCC family protein [Planctomycetota bacterium]